MNEDFYWLLIVDKYDIILDKYELIFIEINDIFDNYKLVRLIM